tara:strand:+ start:6636 stop:7577 length:942 start_codon:yes stop_codon:yes gene_type:complete
MGKKVLILDGYNLLHRARSGFNRGDFPIVFNFFRGVRPIVEKFNPDFCYFTLEGVPVDNLAIDPQYKANRVVDPDDESYKSFKTQKKVCIDLLQSYFPIRVVKHPHYEADDVVYNIVKNCASDDEVTVVSSDSDFIQLYNEFDNVDLWNPISKSFVKKPDYDYVTWKSLRGDTGDNIFGIPGVGDKTALKLVRTPSLLQEKLQNQNFKNIFEKNISLIKFSSFSGGLSNVLHLSSLKMNWNEIREIFETFEFHSMIKESTWEKYVKTFDNLWSHVKKDESCTVVNTAPFESEVGTDEYWNNLLDDAERGALLS